MNWGKKNVKISKKHKTTNNEILTKTEVVKMLSFRHFKRSSRIKPEKLLSLLLLNLRTPSRSSIDSMLNTAAFISVSRWVSIKFNAFRFFHITKPTSKLTCRRWFFQSEFSLKMSEIKAHYLWGTISSFQESLITPRTVRLLRRNKKTKRRRKTTITNLYSIGISCSSWKNKATNMSRPSTSIFQAIMS